MKAAVHNPSLGVVANNDGAIRESGGGGTYSPETNPHHQIARIIANLADQSDADNFPTTIRIGSNEVYGIESLPYFSEIFFKARFRRPNGEEPFDSANGTLYCYFELWNPHQGPIPSDGPSQVRIRSNSGARVMMSYAESSPGHRLYNDRLWWESKRAEPPVPHHENHFAELGQLPGQPAVGGQLH